MAEDNVVNQAVRALLEKRGPYRGGGRKRQGSVEGLDQQTFDVILMDVQMPEMDGFTATTSFANACKRSEGIPIVAMTALAMSGDRERCIAAEMDGYLSKPIRPLQLDEVLDRYTHQKQQDIVFEARKRSRFDPT